MMDYCNLDKSYNTIGGFETLILTESQSKASRFCQDPNSKPSYYIAFYYIHTSYYCWKLICECVSSAWRSGSLSISVNACIDTHDLRKHGPTTLQYMALISVVGKVGNSHWTQYDCKHTLIHYFPAIVDDGLLQLGQILL